MGKKMIGWYQRIKVADASSGENPGINGFEGTGDDPKIDRQVDMMNVPYSVPAPFQVGDQVRERKGGIGSEPSSRGKVSDVANNRMRVEWFSGKRKGTTSSFSLLDAAKLSLTLEKIR